MKISIIGAGNSGCAQACKLIERGHEVCLIKTSHSLHDDNFDVIMSTGVIECQDMTDGGKEKVFHISKATRDIADGLSDADAVLVLTQSLQHKELAPRVSPFLKSGQLVMLIPGNMGSLQFLRHAKQPDIVFVEGESTPYDARIISPGKVQILFKNIRNAVSFTRKSDEPLLEIVDKLFGRHKYLRTSIIESALHNPNLVVHTVGTIMSASRIEYAKGDFWLYREGFSPSTWNIIEKLDAEKMAVMRYYGCKHAESYLDACKWRNEEDLQMDSYAVFQSYAATGGPKGPDSVNTRYITEDVPMGLCLLENLGTLADIPTPMTSALITLANAQLKTDFRAIAYPVTDYKDYVETLMK